MRSGCCDLRVHPRPSPTRCSSCSVHQNFQICVTAVLWATLAFLSARSPDLPLFRTALPHPHPFPCANRRSSVPHTLRRASLEYRLPRGSRPSWSTHCAAAGAFIVPRQEHSLCRDGGALWEAPGVALSTHDCYNYSNLVRVFFLLHKLEASHERFASYYRP